MAKYTRSEFLSRSAALAGALGLGSLVGGSDPPGAPAKGTPAKGSPDLVLLNGQAYTVDDAQPQAQAFAVSNGRFTAVGSTDEVRSLAGPGTEVMDAEGMTVTPGFIDAHSHPAGAGLSQLLHVNVNVRSIAEIKEALRARANETPPGEWVVGVMYDDTKLAEGRPLRRTDLDEAVPNHPVQVNHRGGHTGVYNSRAFEVAGVTAQTPDPEGGTFYRENGELTGRVAEKARYAINKHVPSESTREQRRDGVELISKKMAAAGLTSVHDVWCGAEDLTAYQDARRAGALHFRTYLFPGGGTDLYAALKTAGLRTGFGDEWLRLGAVKYAADGSASERTMRMSTPYEERPDDYGILTMNQEEVHEAVEDAVRHGFQIGIHANGDVAIDMVLNAYERAQRNGAQEEARFRIEHCSLVNENLLRRIKAVGAVPTPFYTYAHYHGNKWGEYGEEKMRRMFAHKSFLEHDIPVASASDYPPGPFPPMMAIQSMVTRKDFDGRVWGPNQRISVDQALRVCTRNGAYASFEEDLKGSITPGKLADFTVLAEDPHGVEPDRIKDIEVVRTVAGGRTTHAVSGA
jgi:predicted amidohydrolase YtcJ